MKRSKISGSSQQLMVSPSTYYCGMPSLQPGNSVLKISALSWDCHRAPAFNQKPIQICFKTDCYGQFVLSATTTLRRYFKDNSYNNILFCFGMKIVFELNRYLSDLYIYLLINVHKSRWDFRLHFEDFSFTSIQIFALVTFASLCLTGQKTALT